MRSPAEIVETIREECKKKGLTIQKLEKELGIGNGSIGKWEKGKRYPQTNRLKLIADSLGVSVSYLTGEEQKNAPATEGSESEVDMKLREFARSASPEELLELHNYIEFIKSKRK